MGNFGSRAPDGLAKVSLELHLEPLFSFSLGPDLQQGHLSSPFSLIDISPNELCPFNPALVLVSERT